MCAGSRPARAGISHTRRKEVGNEMLTTVNWARAQFALTAMYHWIFVPLTLGLSFLIAFFESIYVKTGDESWKKLTKSSAV